MASESVAKVPMDATFWRTLASDTETKKQLVTVALVALLVSAFEVWFFYHQVVPSVHASVGSMVTPAESSTMDPTLRARLDAVLQVMNENEHRLIASSNSATVVYAVLILCLPVLVIVVLLVSSRKLRQTSWGSIRFDVGVMTAAIVAFQLYFHQFTRGWRYPSNHQIAGGICEEYRRRAEEAGGYQPRLTYGDYASLLPSLTDLLGSGWDRGGVVPSVSDRLLRSLQAEAGRFGR